MVSAVIMTSLGKFIYGVLFVLFCSLLLTLCVRVHVCVYVLLEFADWGYLC